MKRSLITLDVKEGGVEIDSINMANCLILLSRGDHEESPSSPERVFECKTCNRQFQSFQALGGHRASHKRARIFEDRHGRALHGCRSNLQKVHECSICGTEFSMGQALGGHMRRHRSELQGGFLSSAAIVKKPIGVQRLYLDLNLPPLDNDGDILGLGLVGKFPMVH